MDVQALLANALGTDGRGAGDDDDMAIVCFGNAFPHLDVMLTCTRAGGVERRPSTLTVFEDSGSITVCLRDRTNGRVLYASGDRFEDALTVLETELQSGKPRWRAERAGKR